MKIEIEYDNDTGPRDAYFREFWRIRLDGEEICQTEEEKYARLIASAFETAFASMELVSDMREHLKELLNAKS